MVCLILSPIADSDLKAFYNLIANDSARLKIFGSFFCCLTSALAYLNNKQIRHRDIKPENILVKGDEVYFRLRHIIRLGITFRKYHHR